MALDRTCWLMRNSFTPAREATTNLRSAKEISARAPPWCERSGTRNKSSAPRCMGLRQKIPSPANGPTRIWSRILILVMLNQRVQWAQATQEAKQNPSSTTYRGSSTAINQENMWKWINWLVNSLRKLIRRQLRVQLGRTSRSLLCLKNTNSRDGS